MFIFRRQGFIAPCLDWTQNLGKTDALHEQSLIELSCKPIKASRRTERGAGRGITTQVYQQQQYVLLLA